MKGIVSHHQEKRRRGGRPFDKLRARKLEPFPSDNFWLWLLDKLTLAAGIIGPLMTIPQILQIYVYQNAQGVSLLTWGAYALLDFPFFIYGVAHRNRLITITYFLWCIANCSVAIGVILFAHAGM